MRKLTLSVTLIVVISLVTLIGCNIPTNPVKIADNTTVSQEQSPSQPQLGEKLEPREKPDPREKPNRRKKSEPVVLAGPSQNKEQVEHSSSFPETGVPILMYHSIADLPGNNLGVPPAKFEEQMKFLHEDGYTTISPETLYNAYQGTGRLPKKPILLTFDDGYPDNYSVAFPVLKQYKFVATFFVITGGIDQGMMTWAQLQEMKDYGMSIQSHTVSHPDLRTVSGASLKREIVDSKKEIESRLNTEVKFFCYPSGKYNAETLKQLKQAGYTMAVTTAYGTATSSQDLLLLNRVRINGSSTLATFKNQLVPKKQTNATKAKAHKNR